jgi:putative ubiquitin-RnfH superfamily antitoxin RatB of RatAB toxin-antitoxin module
MALAEGMKITLVYAPAPRQVLECELELPAGSTLADALRHSGWLSHHPELGDDATIPCGIWGRQAPRETVLRAADRVEFWRDLRVDPKVARRERFRSQGAKTAGLFAQRRPGAKSGY